LPPPVSDAPFTGRPRLGSRPTVAGRDGQPGARGGSGTPGARGGSGGPGEPGTFGGHDPPALLDQAFDAGTLNALRSAVQAHARRAGMAEGRAGEVVLAVHELAANAIRHGAGQGRMRMWHLGTSLRCQVDDAGPGGGEGDGREEPGSADGDLTVTDPWPPAPGHGLWVAREVADQMEVLSGPRGTRAAVIFVLGRPEPREPGR
jgi:anti-sigma regulatory factor (Ser/Thr protein kinase)